MEKWTQLGRTVHLVNRLAKMTLRAQRLVMADRIERLEAMVKIHAPAIRKEPGGEERLQQVYAEFDRARTVLRSLADG